MSLGNRDPLTAAVGTRSAQQQAALRRRLTLAARVSLSAGQPFDARLVSDIADRAGVHPHAVRTLFPTDDVLLDAVNDVLVDECAERLRGGVARFTAVDGDDAFRTASRALAESWPLDRGGMIIRAERRLNALKRGTDGSAAVAAERRFVGALDEVLSDLMIKLGRRFSWSTPLAVRVILDTYERSFEAWILGGHPESEFQSSPFVERTLPTLLEELSEAV